MMGKDPQIATAGYFLNSNSKITRKKQIVGEERQTAINLVPLHPVSPALYAARKDRLQTSVQACRHRIIFYLFVCIYLFPVQ